MKLIQLLSLVIVGVAFTMLGDLCFKHSDGGYRKPFLLYGMALYLAGAIPIPFLFKLTRFGTVFVVWEASTILLATVVGYLCFGERPTVANLTALVLVLGALLLQTR